MFLFIQLFGISTAGLGLWALFRLAEMYNEFGTYPAGEHLFGGGLFVLGATIAIGTAIVEKIYEQRKGGN
jgi:hypothetical protein